MTLGIKNTVTDNYGSKLNEISIDHYQRLSQALLASYVRYESNPKPFKQLVNKYMLDNQGFYVYDPKTKHCVMIFINLNAIGDELTIDEFMTFNDLLNNNYM